MKATKIFNMLDEDDLKELNRIMNLDEANPVLSKPEFVSDNSCFVIVAMDMSVDLYNKEVGKTDTRRWECPVCFKKFKGVNTINVAGRSRAFCPECSDENSPVGEYEMKELSDDSK